MGRNGWMGLIRGSRSENQSVAETIRSTSARKASAKTKNFRASSSLSREIWGHDVKLRKGNLVYCPRNSRR